MTIIGIPDIIISGIFFLYLSSVKYTIFNREKVLALMEGKFQYNFGDFVKVMGYGDVIFKIIGIVEENYHYPNETMREEIYVCESLLNQEIIESYLEDIIYHQKGEEVASSGRKKKKIKRIKEDAKNNTIDELLDKYNDYIRLYKMFDDEKYKRYGQRILSKIYKMKEEGRI